MMKRYFKFACLCFLMCCGIQLVAQKKNPNVIVIMADDLGYGDLSCYGHPTIRTPFLDKMAQEGMRFTQFYSAANLCTPSRAGLLTGRMAVRTGMHSSPTKNNLYPTSKGGLPAYEITIAEALKDRNYKTGMIGKWHLGILPEFMPVNNGFDYYYGVPYSNDMFPKPANKYPPLPMYRNDKVVESGTEQRLITQKYTAEAMEFIKANKNQPFFLYYASNAPHSPLYASERFEGKSSRGIYGDVVQELDWSVGKIMELLEDLKIDKNTLIIFCSDNGPWLKNKEAGGTAGLLKGGKGSANEGGTRVPAIAWWPGTIPAGQVNESVVSALDLFPTFLSLAGGTPAKDRIYDGANISSLLTQTAVEKNGTVYYYTRDKLCAVRKGAWKATFRLDEIYGDKKANPLIDKPLLYNLGIDPSELYDVSAKNPEIMDDLQRAYTSQMDNVKPGPSELDKF